MRIAHTASVMFSQFLSMGGGGGAGVSQKVHSEHIVATKVLMPRGGWVSRKVHSVHILATKSAHAHGGLGVWENALFR